MREGGEGKEGRKGERERDKDTEFKLNSLDKGPFIPLAKKETDIVAFSMSWVINYKWNVIPCPALLQPSTATLQIWTLKLNQVKSGNTFNWELINVEEASKEKGRMARGGKYKIGPKRKKKENFPSQTSNWAIGSQLFLCLLLSSALLDLDFFASRKTRSRVRDVRPRM